MIQQFVYAQSSKIGITPQNYVAIIARRPFQLDLKHVDQVRGSNIVNIGIDLSEFYLSVEWDILEVPATRNEEYYLPQVSKCTICMQSSEMAN